MKQACVTKWFKPIDPSKVGQYHEWLFEKELADREKRKAEHEARIKAVCNIKAFSKCTGPDLPFDDNFS
jgi:hypothetical protein